MIKILKQIRAYIRLLPYLLRYSKAKYFEGSIVVLPHEGLGDLIAIMPALQELSTKGKITIICDQEKWDQILETFEDVPNVSVRHFIENKTYKIPTDLYYGNEHLIALGWYSRFPIYKYPQSFYFQMGVPSNICRRQLRLKPTNNKYDLPDEYSFIDLSTSKGIKCPLPNKDIYGHDIPTVEALGKNTLRVKTSDKEYNISLDSRRCFCEKVHIAMNARKIICSDAALFNALIRLNIRKPLTVLTRDHVHPHDKVLYKKCRFDGGLHEFNG